MVNDSVVMGEAVVDGFIVVSRSTSVVVGGAVMSVVPYVLIQAPP